jgi:predicted glycosyltransferase
LRPYDGLKENVYLGDFEPDPDTPAAVGFSRDDGRALVVTRTPPSRALYHRRENDLYLDLLRKLGDQEGVLCVVLPRYPEQVDELRALGLPGLHVAADALDARSLMHAADLVVGGGGTMTREAALMGIPTLSVFSARRPAVDRWLEDQGLLEVLTSVDRVANVARRPAEPRTPAELRARGEEVLARFVETTLEMGRGA